MYSTTSVLSPFDYVVLNRITLVLPKFDIVNLVEDSIFDTHLVEYLTDYQLIASQLNFL